MSIFKINLSQVWQELPAILYFIVTQACYFFYHVSSMSRLELVIGLLANIVAAWVFLSTFIFPERHVGLLKVFLFGSSKAPFLKASLTLGPIFLVQLLGWYIDVYGMSNMEYPLFYAHTVMIFFLACRAVNRYQVQLNSAKL